MCIISFDLPKNPMRKGLFLSPFNTHAQMEWCSERLRPQSYNVSEAQVSESRTFSPTALVDPLHALDASSGPIPGSVPTKQCEAIFLFLGGVGCRGLSVLGR